MEKKNIPLIAWSDFSSIINFTRYASLLWKFLIDNKYQKNKRNTISPLSKLVKYRNDPAQVMKPSNRFADIIRTRCYITVSRKSLNKVTGFPIRSSRGSEEIYFVINQLGWSISHHLSRCTETCRATGAEFNKWCVLLLLILLLLKLASVQQRSEGFLTAVS